MNSTNKIRWGILGVAKIATQKVIPAMQKGALCEIAAIASRDISRAKEAAELLGIPKAYGSYEELLADDEIDAIYNPLPNHLHVSWTTFAAQAGKHVLCEKPIALSAAEAELLVQARDTHKVLIGEAFMVHTHPQWLRAIEILKSGEIGNLRAFNFVFSYDNRDPHNIRNIREIGGGALMDIGCYPIHTSRWVFDAEPKRVSCLMERDPVFDTDRLVSAILDYPQGQAVFTCSTQMTPHQRAQIFGEKGYIEIEIPVNAPPDAETRIFVKTAAGLRTETIPTCDQYTIQGDAFSKAISDGSPVPVTVEDAVCNMAVIDALFRSAESGDWETPRA